MEFITRDDQVADRLELLAQEIIRLKSELSNLSAVNRQLKAEREELQNSETHLKSEVEKLNNQISRLDKDLKLANLSKPAGQATSLPVNSSGMDENERKAIKLQIEALVGKINEHLEA